MTTNQPRRHTSQREEQIRQLCAEHGVEIVQRGSSLRLVGRDVDILVRSFADVQLSDIQPLSARRR